jgi:plastocyanin
MTENWPLSKFRPARARIRTRAGRRTPGTWATGGSLGVGFVLAALLAAGAQTGIPPGIAGYTTWTEMNGAPLTDPSNARAGPKNAFINLRPDQLREIVGAGGLVRRPFPDGATIVRETLDPVAGFVRVLFVMRYDAAAVKTKEWAFSGYTRSSADKPFEEVAIADPVARCLNCHAQVKASDYVFTPYTNRPDLPPARVPSTPQRVEIFNYRFGPQALHVKVGTTVAWANYDAVPHDVKAADKSFESGNLPPFGAYVVTFTHPGTIEYFCAVHLGMRGTIVIEP